MENLTLQKSIDVSKKLEKDIKLNNIWRTQYYQPFEDSTYILEHILPKSTTPS